MQINQELVKMDASIERLIHDAQQIRGELETLKMRLASIKKEMVQRLTDIDDCPAGAVNTGRTDTLGRPIFVDKFGRREWRARDYDKPPGHEHLTDREWHNLRKHVGPVSV